MFAIHTITCRVPAALLLGMALLLAGCSGKTCTGMQTQVDAENMAPTVVFNLTSDPQANAHSLVMAMQLASIALDDQRDVVLFFNVKATMVPTTGFPSDDGYHGNRLKPMLAQLIERGADVQVCPMCFQAAGGEAKDLIAGARLSDRAALFDRIGPNTVVFSY